MGFSLSRSIGRFLYGKLLPRGVAYPVLRGPLKGTRFVLGSAAGGGGGGSVYFNLSEPEQTARIVAALRPGDTFFDVGANVGYYSLIAARTVGRSGRVIAFEPLPDNIVHLCRHVRINRLANVDVLAVACSDAVGITSFTTGSNGALGHISDVATVAAGQGGPGGGMTTWVPTVDLDGFVARTGFRPNVIKIDVEGAERRVLDGASELLQRHGPEIFLSTHGDEMRDVCLKVLRGYGYEVRPLNAADESSASEFHAKRQ